MERQDLHGVGDTSGQPDECAVQLRQYRDNDPEERDSGSTQGHDQYPWRRESELARSNDHYRRRLYGYPSFQLRLRHNIYAACDADRAGSYDEYAL